MAKEEDFQAQPTLIFIPDISGFTKFVKSTEIAHSQHIVEELLELLIDANEMDLEISEIEGDAILFYRQGPKPTAAEILAQVQRMYVKFHAQLKKYETQRICQCGACSSANGLALKFVLHFGEISKKRVKNFTKLFGSDLILAHRLMKNEVKMEEYVLFTHQLLNACSAWVEMKQAAWADPNEGEDNYDNDLVKYCYLPLAPLAAHVPEPRVEDFSVGGSVRGLEVEGTVSATLDMVFDVISDLSYRDKWIAGLTGSDGLNGKITKTGSTHTCVMSGTPDDPSFVSHKFDISNDVVTWVESDHRAKWDVVIRLQRIGRQLTRAQYTFFIRPNLIQRLLFKYKTKKMLGGWVAGNLITLDAYCKQLIEDGKEHPNQITLPSAEVTA